MAYLFKDTILSFFGDWGGWMLILELFPYSWGETTQTFSTELPFIFHVIGYYSFVGPWKYSPSLHRLDVSLKLGKPLNVTSEGKKSTRIEVKVFWSKIKGKLQIIAYILAVSSGLLIIQIQAKLCRFIAVFPSAFFIYTSHFTPHAVLIWWTASDL